MLSVTAYTQGQDIPLLLMLGRQARIQADLVFQRPQDQPTYHNQYVAKLQQTMWEAYKRVQEKMGHHLKKQKEIYDKKAHGQLHSKGDKVWLFNAAVPKGKSRKFHKPWSGTYTV